jgi:hypothetical protein
MGDQTVSIMAIILQLSLPETMLAKEAKTLDHPVVEIT